MLTECQATSQSCNSSNLPVTSDPEAEASVPSGGERGVPGPALTPHPCTMCNKQFTRADDLKKHLKSSHITSNCSVCGQLFQDKVALAKHQVEVGNHKGTFNKYVRMKIGLFDPPSPLVRKMTSLLLHSLIY